MWQPTLIAMRTSERSGVTTGISGSPEEEQSGHAPLPIGIDTRALVACIRSTEY